MEEFVLDAKDAALAVDGSAHLVALLSMVSDEMLLAVLDPFYRALQPHRGDADQHILRIKFTAHTEAAADVPLKELH